MLEGPVIRIKVAHRLHADALLNVSDVVLPFAETPHVHGPEILVRVPLYNPLGQRHPRTARAGDAHRVHTAGHKKVLHTGHFSQHVSGIRSEALRHRGHAAHAGISKLRHPVHCVFHEELHLIPVVLKLGILEFFRNAVQPPCFGVGFKSAHEEPSHLLFDVDVTIQISQVGHIFVDAFYRFGRHVHVLGGKKRQAGANHLAHFPSPHSGTVDQVFTGDLAFIGLHAGDPVAVHSNAGHLRVLEDLSSAHAGPLRERLGGVLGVGDTVIGLVPGPGQIIGSDHRYQPPGLIETDFLHPYSKCPGHPQSPKIFLPSRRGSGDTNGTVSFVSGGLAGFHFQTGVKIGTVFCQLGQRAGGPELPQQAGGRP